MKPHFVLSTLVLALASCSTVEPIEIPGGTYRESGTSNFIQISGEQARVHIKGVDDRDNGGTGLVFKYAVWRDGQLWLVVSRSAELMYGYPALEYYWDGSQILAKDPKANVRWRFAPQPSP